MTYDPKGELLKGVIAKWNGGTLATEIAPLRQGPAPTGLTSHPYALLSGADLVDLGMTCGIQRFEMELEFRVYHRTPELVGVLKGKVDQVFSSDSLSLSLTGVELESCRLVASSDDKQDENVSLGSLSYRFRFSRSRIA